MRSDYVRRFHEMVEELRKRPDIAVARVHVAPPVSEDTIARVHAKLGFSISERILDFYRQANGLALEWVPKQSAAYDPASHDEECSEPFDMVPQDVAGGVLNIYPLESIVDDYEDVFWFEWMAGQTTEFNGETHDLLAFSKSIRPFDYFSECSMAAFLLHDRAAYPRVLIGDDHGASFTQFPPTDFETYMEGMLALRGSGIGRERFFMRGERPLPGTPEAWREIAPTLDELVQWSLERDADGSVDGSHGDDFGSDEFDDEDFEGDDADFDLGDEDDDFDEDDETDE